MAKKKRKDRAGGESASALEVQSYLRREIVAGRLKPGDRFPTRLQMRSTFRLAAETTQRVFDLLIQDGYATARGMAGTFVAAKPPHLSNFGLVFANHSEGQGWSRYETALFNEATAMDDGKDLRLKIYRKVHFQNESPDYTRMLDDVGAWRVGGLVFVNPPRPEVVADVFARSPGMPCVAIWSRSEIPGVGAVSLGGEAIGKAMEHFVARGRKRVAFLSAWGSGAFADRYERTMQLEAESHGLTTEPGWMLQVHLDAVGSARNIMQLLFARKEFRPDALFITDDNLVEPATVGILAAGVRVPEELDVVAHANFPWLTSSVVASRRLGYDAREIIETCIDVLRRQGRGEDVNSPVTVRARFAEELARKAKV